MGCLRSFVDDKKMLSARKWKGGESALCRAELTDKELRKTPSFALAHPLLSGIRSPPNMVRLKESSEVSGP